MYKFDVEICVCDNIFYERNKARDILIIGSKYSGKEDDFASLCSVNEDMGRCIVYISWDAIMSDIAHECWHCVQAMFVWIGAGIENEITAYTLGYLIDQVDYILQYS